MLTKQEQVFIIMVFTKKKQNKKGGVNMESIKKIIDRDNLRAEMARHNVGTGELAKILGISSAGLAQKFSLKSQFSEEQIYVLYKTFGTAIFLK